MNKRTQHIEDIFMLLDESSIYIVQQFGKSYLEGLIDTAEQLFQQEMVLDITEQQKQKLKSLLQGFRVESYTKEDVRRGFQLAVLKGMKELHTIPGTGVTPDAVVMFTAYLTQKLAAIDQVKISSPETSATIIYDPAVGSGNLLTGVCNYLPGNTIGVATEVESLLVHLAYVNANLQQHEVEIYHQDGLKPVFLDYCDLVVCDLPVGIYPNLKVAQRFELYREGEETYTHHLLIEQAMQYVKAGGYMIFIIPNTMFTEPGADHLRTYIMKHAYIQALLQLPQQLFQKGSIYKSIFILQKKGEAISKPKQTLMAQLPAFTDESKITDMLQHIQEWLQNEKGEMNG